ncbi:MAG: hypothetical protein R2838_26890 [Caldilineaceae bacterium]
MTTPGQCARFTRADFFNGSEPTGDVVRVQEIGDVSLLWLGAPRAWREPGELRAAHLSGRLTRRRRQSHPYRPHQRRPQPSLSGRCAGHRQLDQPAHGRLLLRHGHVEETAVVDLVAGQAHGSWSVLAATVPCWRHWW